MKKKSHLSDIGFIACKFTDCEGSYTFEDGTSYYSTFVRLVLKRGISGKSTFKVNRWPF
jgi:hypothetical protein